MYANKKSKTPVQPLTLIHRDGASWKFQTIKALLEQLSWRWVFNNVGPHFGIGYSFKIFRTDAQHFERIPRTADYIMRDGVGIPVTADTLTPGLRQLNAGYHRGQAGGPVPNTGRSRCQPGREIRYANALRAEATFKDEGEVALRSKRRTTFIVQLWDDYPAYARRDRSWKRYRNTQWK